MKLTAPQNVLAAVCGWVTATARLGKPQVSPVLAGLLLAAEPDGTLTVTGYDHEVSAVARLSAEVQHPGRALIGARLLTEAARALPAQPVDLVMDGTRVTLAAGPVTYTLLALPHDDYPALPDPGPHAAEFPAPVLAAVVAQATSAAGHDDTLPALTCTHLTLDGGTATLAATDRYRLAVATCPYTPAEADPPGPVLIPARDLAALTRHPGDGPVRVAISADGAVAGFSTGDRHVTTRLVCGEYPAYAQLIPAASDVTATVTADVAALAAAIKRAAVVADRGTPVRLGFTPGEVLIESGTSEEASLAETLPVGLDGDPARIAFNPGYLLDVLTAIAATGSTAARIAITSPAKPAVLTPAEASGPVGVTHVLMPIRCAG